MKSLLSKYIGLAIVVALAVFCVPSNFAFAAGTQIHAIADYGVLSDTGKIPTDALNSASAVGDVGPEPESLGVDALTCSTSSIPGDAVGPTASDTTEIAAEVGDWRSTV